MEDVFYAVRLYRCKQSLFQGNAWKETWLQLKTDGSLIWYNDKQCTKSSGFLNINNIAAHLKIGDVAKRKLTKVCPKLPFDYSESAFLMALPDRKNTRGAPTDVVKWFWFCFKCEKDLLLTLKHYAKFFDYEKAYEEFFNVQYDDDEGKYHLLRYGTTMTGDYGNATQLRYGMPITGDYGNSTKHDWGLMWEKFMMEIAPNKFLRRRRRCRKYTPIEIATEDTKLDEYDISRKDSCIDTESNVSGHAESFRSSELSSQRESEDLGIPNSNSDDSCSETDVSTLHKCEKVTVEIHSSLRDIV